MTTEGEKSLFDVLGDHSPVLTIVAFDCRIWSIMRHMCPALDLETLRATHEVQVLELAKKFCIHMIRRRRYSIAEQPWSAASWKYQNS
eukprot:1056869-Pyramimonas_sp.AAC.1